MRLTTFTDYSLRVLMHVATAPAGRTTIGEIARAFSISENHLVKVVHLLGQEGFLVNTRGRGGGVALARPCKAINVGQLVRITEGGDVPAECFAEGCADRCAIVRVCRLAGVFDEAVRAFYAVLDRYTLQDLIADPAPLAAILHRPAARA